MFSIQYIFSIAIQTIQVKKETLFLEQKVRSPNVNRNELYSEDQLHNGRKVKKQNMQKTFQVKMKHWLCGFLSVDLNKKLQQVKFYLLRLACFMCHVLTLNIVNTLIYRYKLFT